MKKSQVEMLIGFLLTAAVFVGVVLGLFVYGGIEPDPELAGPPAPPPATEAPELAPQTETPAPPPPTPKADPMPPVERLVPGPNGLPPRPEGWYDPPPGKKFKKEGADLYSQEQLHSFGSTVRFLLSYLVEDRAYAKWMLIRFTRPDATKFPADDLGQFSMSPYAPYTHKLVRTLVIESDSVMHRQLQAELAKAWMASGGPDRKHEWDYAEVRYQIDGIVEEARKLDGWEVSGFNDPQSILLRAELGDMRARAELAYWWVNDTAFASPAEIDIYGVKHPYNGYAARTIRKGAIGSRSAAGTVLKAWLEDHKSLGRWYEEKFAEELRKAERRNN